MMSSPKVQLLAILAFGLAMLFIENQIQKLDESRAKLGKNKTEASHFVVNVAQGRQMLVNEEWHLETSRFYYMKQFKPPY